MRLSPIKHLDFSKLFICQTNYSNLTKFREERLNPLNMYFSILATGTMANIYGKLEHRKAVFL